MSQLPLLRMRGGLDCPTLRDIWNTANVMAGHGAVTPHDVAVLAHCRYCPYCDRCLLGAMEIAASPIDLMDDRGQ